MLASNDNAIKRFTYDWLIRFAELHPFTFYDYRDDEVQWRVGAYNPMSSEYAAVSPMFTTLMTRYMPYIFHSDFIKTENGKIKEVDVPSTHKYKIYACTWCHILGPTTPGMISLLEANRVIIYSQLVETRSTALFENTLTVNELKYLLKFGPRDRLFQVCGTLSEPFKFAEMWPLLQHYKEMRIELQNLTYDDNIATVLRENQVFPNEVEFCRLNISDQAVLEMVDYFLSLPKFPELVTLQFQQLKPVSLREAIITKLLSIGFKNNSKPSPEVPFCVTSIRWNTVLFLMTFHLSFNTMYLHRQPKNFC